MSIYANSGFSYYLQNGTQVGSENFYPQSFTGQGIYVQKDESGQFNSGNVQSLSFAGQELNVRNFMSTQIESL